MSPLEQAKACIDAANEERTKMLMLCMVLIEKLGNDVVITNGELEAIGPNTSIKQTPPTDIGFTISTVKVQNGKPPN